MIEQTITKSSVVEIISIKISSLIDTYSLTLNANKLSNHSRRPCTFPDTYGVFHANENSIHRETSWNNTGLPGKRETSERSVLFTSSLRLLFYQRLLSLELATYCFTWQPWRRKYWSKARCGFKGFSLHWMFKKWKYEPKIFFFFLHN